MKRHLIAAMDGATFLAGVVQSQVPKDQLLKPPAVAQ